ncbi:hypothetical protein MBLNU230_g3566t1 [Neophaeotheca triangularis]
MPPATPTIDSTPFDVQHSFDGDPNVLNATFDRRAEIRKLMTRLQEDLHRILPNEGPMQVAANISIRVAAPQAKEHTYSVTVRDSAFNLAAFEEKRKHASTSSAQNVAAKAMAAVESSPAVTAAAATATAPNGRRTSSIRPGAPRETTHDDIYSDEPARKRPRTSITADEDQDLTITSTRPSPRSTESMLREILTLLQTQTQTTPTTAAETLQLLRTHQPQWQSQASWLYDTLNTTNTTLTTNLATVTKKLDSVQHILGQSINASNSSVMAELSNINTKTLPWLENCRKAAADKAMAREEKWRSSSANFHDQSRREREVAEGRLEKGLEGVGEGVARLEKVVKGLRGEGAGDEGELNREGSLGAQVRWELNGSVGGGADREAEGVA